MARESLHVVEQMMVDDYREKHPDNEELLTLSDREVLQMCAPTVHDYKIYFERLLNSLTAEKEKREQSLAELRANYDNLFDWQKREKDGVGEEIKADITKEEGEIRSLESRIAEIRKEKKERMARFYGPKSSRR